MKREEIEIEYTWKMEDVFASDELFLEEYEKVEQELDKVGEFAGHLGDSAQMLLAYFQFRDEVNVRIGKVYFYANQRLHENLGNPLYQEYAGKTENLENRWMTLTAFEEPELLQVGEDRIQTFIQECEGLAVYQYYLSEVFRTQEHILPGEMAKLLAMAGEMASGPSDVFAKFSNVDLQFPDVQGENGQVAQLTHGNYTKYMESRDRQVRKSAFEAMYQTYERYGNLFAALYQTSVKKDNFYAKAQKYDSALAMELDANDIPQEVYHSLIGAVHGHMHLMHRYVALRRQFLQYDQLHMYDVYTPFIPHEERVIPFEEAKEIIQEALAPMGEEYLSILQEGLNNRWVDVYENEGKRSGAYSWSCYGCHPYVLLNYQSNLDSVFTLAHEMGHAIHSYYTNKSQPAVYSNYAIFVAEVASICNEALLLHYLIEHSADRQEKAYLIQNYLEKFRGTLFRQVMFAEFELKTHQKVEQGDALTRENLCQLYYQLNQQYYGTEMAEDRLIEMEWARIPHFYTPFYVYQYATGFAAAISLSADILREGKPAVERYLRFLSGGCSRSPIELLQLAGVDMASEAPVRNAMRVMEELLDQIEELGKTKLEEDRV